MPVCEPAAVRNFTQRVDVRGGRLGAVATLAERVLNKIVLVVELVSCDLGHGDGLVVVMPHRIVGVKLLAEHHYKK